MSPFALASYQYNVWAIPYAVSAVVCFVVAASLSRSKTQAERAFMWNIVPVGIAHLACIPLACARSAEVAHFWTRFALAPTAFAGPAILHTVVVLVGWQKQLRWTRVGFWLCAIVMGTLAFTSNLLMSSAWRTAYGWSGRAGPLLPVQLLLIAASTTPAFAILISHARSAPSAIQRRRYGYILIAFFIGMFSAFDYLPFYGMRVTPSSYLPVTLTSITIYYSLRHERPADLPTFFGRTLVWAALSALVFVPVAILAWLSRGWAGWRDPLVAALALYTVFLGMRWYLRRVQPRIDHLFHRRKHDLDAAAARFAERVAVLHTAADLGRAAHAVLEQTVYARLCAFAVPPDPEAQAASRDPLPWKVVYSAWGSVPPPDGADPLLKRMQTEPQVVTREAVAHGAVADVRAQAERMFARYGAEALLALVDQSGGRVLGLMAVSSRAGGRPFSDLELDFLDRLRTHAAAALVQARLYDQLHRLRQELEEKVAARTQELARAAAGLESAQQMLVQQEKMSLLGLLVSGVAQDLLNAVERAHSQVPDLVAHLAALQVAMDLCRDAAGETAREELAPREKDVRLDYIRRDLGALVDAIAEGARRATAIAQDLRRFARADTVTRQAADLHAGLESTLNLLRHEFKGDRVKVERDYDMEIPPLECYPGPLNQVFMNLLLNAAQAIEEKGVITIRTRRVDPDRIEVVVRDTGKGIPRENLGRIFEPFFTTKGQGGRSGSGLGLAISYGIIERHGGRIQVDSEVGKGTEFRVVLPIRAPGPPLASRLPD